jgi:manganese/iron transport system ATP-binding protein/manganese/zinc/iron transport system ATP- binding protein
MSAAEPTPVVPTAAPAPTLLRADGLAAGYGGPPVLRDVTFAAQAGQRVAVLGPNGGGKTTLFRTLLGELRPQAGTLAAPPRIGVVPQTERSRLDFPVSALDVALMGTLSTLPWWRRPGRHERERARQALADVGLADRAHRTFGDLSGGQRQRVLVARALVQDAPVLLLDEPYVGLDNPSVALLDDLLTRLVAQGRALLIATHDVDQARHWERVLCLNRRQVAFGAPDAVLTRETLERTYGVELVDVTGERCVLPPHHHEHDHDHDHDAA